MIEAQNVCLNVAERVLLRDVTFSARPGELVAILGPNGAGKTTLLKAIAGLHAVASGSLTIAGTPVGQIDPTQRARMLALMTSEDAAIDDVSVREVVASGRFSHHSWWQWYETQPDDEAISAALASVQMERFAQRRFATLSTGERQRIWLALGLAQEAAALLLDEPTSHLDVRVSHEILALLRAQSQRGKTVICVLHDINEALEFADRIAVLGEQTLLAYERPEALARSGVLNRTYGVDFEVLRAANGTLRVFPITPLPLKR